MLVDEGSHAVDIVVDDDVQALFDRVVGGHVLGGESLGHGEFVEFGDWRFGFGRCRMESLRTNSKVAEFTIEVIG